MYINATEKSPCYKQESFGIYNAELNQALGVLNVPVFINRFPQLVQNCIRSHMQAYYVDFE